MVASLRFAPGRPLTASFPGKIGAYREDGERARITLDPGLIQRPACR